MRGLLAVSSFSPEAAGSGCRKPCRMWTNENIKDWMWGKMYRRWKGGREKRTELEEESQSSQLRKFKEEGEVEGYLDLWVNLHSNP